MKRLKQKRTARRNNRRGTAMVEFVICLPVLVLILFGTVEACSMIYLNQSLKIAAYEGARVSLVPTSNSGNVEAAGNQVLNDRNIQGGTVAVAPSNFDTLPYGTFIAVSVSAPCESNTLLGAIFYAGRDISVTVEMMKES